MGKNGLAILEISDGTTTVNLLANKNGFGVRDWRPSLAGLRGGGTWHEAPFVHGRRLVNYQFENVVDTFDLTINGDNQDFVIAQTRKLRQLLQKGRDYWTSRWHNDPVWIKARGSLETNARYAIIHDWSTPDDANPYVTPFFKCDGDVVISEFSMIVEHGIWQNSIPGSHNCIPTHSYKERHVNYLTLDGSSQRVILESAAAIDNIPLADFTAEAWIRIPVDSAQTGVIIGKDDQAVHGWMLRVNATNRLFTEAIYTGVDADAIQASGNLADGMWHHVACTFNAATDLFVLWVDGVDVTGTTHAGTVAYADDAAELAYIGGTANGGMFRGDIGWVRLSTTRLYTAAFTPWPRWKLPPITADTIGVWIWEGYGITAHNLEGTSALDGYLYDGANNDEEALWGSDMDFVAGHMDGATYSNNPTAPIAPKEDCDFPGVYFTNSHHYAELTHVFRYDASLASYSANLLTEPLPYYILPVATGQNDAIYFIVQDSSEFSGPFSNIILNITRNIAYPFTFDCATVWEYWNGAAWVDLDTNYALYETSAFGDEAGPHPVSFIVPDDWATSTVNGITGFAVRLRQTDVCTDTSPTQTGQQIYTVTWPYLKINNDDVSGDIPALVQLYLQNLMDYDSGTPKYRDYDTIYMGLRSISRGDNFSAYLNISDVHPAHDWICTDNSAGGAFYSDVTAPTGRCYRYNPAGAVSDEIIVYFDVLSQVKQYFGTYRVFLRGKTISGAEEELSFQLSIGLRNAADNDVLWMSEVKDWVGTELTDVIDFGEVTIPPVTLRPDEELINLFIHIHANNSTAAAKIVHLYDLIFIPIDEWFAAVKHIIDPTASSNVVYKTDVFMIDSVGNPKYSLRSFGQNKDGELKYMVRADGSEVIYQSNADQRLWVFVLGNLPPSALRRSYHDTLSAAKANGALRYFSMRGAT